MFEKVYRSLLHLYPARFRDEYREDLMQLFRDRWRDEKGFVHKTRLLCDLLADLAVSLPRVYAYGETALRRAPLDYAAASPGFHVLDSGPPSAGAIAYGAMLSLLIFGSVFVWIGHVRNFRMLALMQSRPTRTVSAPAMTAAPMDQREAEGGEVGTNISEAARMVAMTPSSARDGDLRTPPHVRLASVSASRQAFEAQGAEAKAQDATKAMIQAISTHQIVMFGETHANKQEYEWLCQLVKTPGFANRVDDIVVEFGNSLYQKSVDRYIAGEDVPLEQVQKAWRNMIGAVGPVSPVYGWFYKAVRESNMQRRGGHQIRLLLGDPYGDWERINNAEDLGPYLAHRDQWYSQVVKDEVLSKNHRALLIMGAGHFLRRNGPGEVESAIRAVGTQPYLVVFGTNVTGGYEDLDRRFDSWPVPAIAGLSGNWAGDLPAMPVLTGGMVAANSLKMSDVADAMLYAGPRDSLTQVSVPKADLEGTAYGKEVSRRLMIQTGNAMEFTQEAEGPQFHRPLQQTLSNGIHRVSPLPPKSIHDPLPPRPASQ